MGNTAPRDTAPACTRLGELQLAPDHPGCLPWHRGATCRDIFPTQSCHSRKHFAKPHSPAGGEAGAEWPSPQLQVPPAAPVGAIQKPFPKRTSHQWHWPQTEIDHSLQHMTAEEPRLPCVAQHNPISRCPMLRVPGTGMVQPAQMLVGMPRGPVPSHGAQARDPRGKRQVTTILRGSTGEEGTGRERVCCQIPASDLRNFQTTLSIMDAREASAVRAAAGPGPTNSYSTR